MANTKVFLIFILFTATLISFYEASARELAGGSPQSTSQTQSVEESKQYGYGGDNPIDQGRGPIYGSVPIYGRGPSRKCDFYTECSRIPPRQP